jgi:hypothetical protein
MLVAQCTHNNAGYIMKFVYSIVHVNFYLFLELLQPPATMAVFLLGELFILLLTSHRHWASKKLLASSLFGRYLHLNLVALHVSSAPCRGAELLAGGLKVPASADSTSRDSLPISFQGASCAYSQSGPMAGTTVYSSTFSSTLLVVLLRLYFPPHAAARLLSRLDLFQVQKRFFP